MAKKSKKDVGGRSELTYRAAKRMAVSLGMPFPDACAASHWQLTSWAAKSNQHPDPELIIKYDEWMDKQLADRGYQKGDPMRHYQLRLSYISDNCMDGIPKLVTKKTPKKPREVKPKREKDESGLWKGTKKSYTFELTQRGYPLERVTRRVIKKFPDANPASIKQWWKKATKQIKDGE